MAADSHVTIRSLSNTAAGRQLLSRLAVATNQLFAPTVATAARILADFSPLPKTLRPPAAAQPEQIFRLPLPPPLQQQQQQQQSDER